MILLGRRKVEKLGCRARHASDIKSERVLVLGEAMRAAVSTAHWWAAEYELHCRAEERNDSSKKQTDFERIAGSFLRLIY